MSTKQEVIDELEKEKNAMKDQIKYADDEIEKADLRGYCQGIDLAVDRIKKITEL